MSLRIDLDGPSELLQVFQDTLQKHRGWSGVVTLGRQQNLALSVLIAAVLKLLLTLTQLYINLKLLFASLAANASGKKGLLNGRG
jgi:hypothetical protein